MIKLVIFDVDGTLVDSETVYIKSALETCKRYGYKFSLDDIKSIIGQTKDAIRLGMEKLGGPDFDYDLYLKRKDEIAKEILKEHYYELKKGTLDILNYCKENNIKMAIATSTYREVHTEILGRLGIFDYFDYKVFGDEIKHSKPNPEIYLKVVNHFKDIKKEEMLIFEDSNNGILSANAAGIKVVWVPDHVDIKDSTKKLVYKTIDNLKDGIDIIKEYE